MFGIDQFKAGIVRHTEIIAIDSHPTGPILRASGSTANGTAFRHVALHGLRQLADAVAFDASVIFSFRDAEDTQITVTPFTQDGKRKYQVLRRSISSSTSPILGEHSQQAAALSQAWNIFHLTLDDPFQKAGDTAAETEAKRLSVKLRRLN
jgi:hypothetical protein